MVAELLLLNRPDRLTKNSVGDAAVYCVAASRCKKLVELLFEDVTGEKRAVQNTGGDTTT